MFYPEPPPGLVPAPATPYVPPAPATPHIEEIPDDAEEPGEPVLEPPETAVVPYKPPEPVDTKEDANDWKIVNQKGRVITPDYDLREVARKLNSEKTCIFL